MRSRKGVRSLRDLHEDFVRLDHADFRAGTLFDHFQTVFEVVEFSAKAIVGQLRGSVLLFLILTVVNAWLVNRWEKELAELETPADSKTEPAP